MKNNKEIVSKKDLKRLMDGATAAVILTNNGECVQGFQPEILTMTVTYLKKLKKHTDEDIFNKMMGLVNKSDEEIRNEALEMVGDILGKVSEGLTNKANKSDNKKESA